MTARRFQNRRGLGHPVWALCAAALVGLSSAVLACAPAAAVAQNNGNAPACTPEQPASVDDRPSKASAAAGNGAAGRRLADSHDATESTKRNKCEAKLDKRTERGAPVDGEIAPPARPTDAPNGAATNASADAPADAPADASADAPTSAPADAPVATAPVAAAPASSAPLVDSSDSSAGSEAIVSPTGSTPVAAASTAPSEVRAPSAQQGVALPAPVVTTPQVTRKPTARNVNRETTTVLAGRTGAGSTPGGAVEDEQGASRVAEVRRGNDVRTLEGSGRATSRPLTSIAAGPDGKQVVASATPDSERSGSPAPNLWLISAALLFAGLAAGAVLARAGVFRRPSGTHRRDYAVPRSVMG